MLPLQGWDKCSYSFRTFLHIWIENTTQKFVLASWSSHCKLFWAFYVFSLQFEIKLNGKYIVPSNHPSENQILHITFTTVNTHWGTKQRAVAAKLTRLIQKVAVLPCSGWELYCILFLILVVSSEAFGYAFIFVRHHVFFSIGCNEPCAHPAHKSTAHPGYTTCFRGTGQEYCGKQLCSGELLVHNPNWCDVTCRINTGKESWTVFVVYKWWLFYFALVLLGRVL